MKFTSLISNKEVPFNGPLIISPNVHQDNRGYFFESWNSNTFNEIIGERIEFVQDNQSKSEIGVLRGLHYQLPPMAQAKLVRATKGFIFDVIVDLRKKSKTFGKCFKIILSRKNTTSLFIPKGFGHAYFSFENENIIYYKLDNYYNPKFEFGIDFNDPTLDIKLPRVKIKISKKDRNLLSLDEFKKKFKFL